MSKRNLVLEILSCRCGAGASSPLELFEDLVQNNLCVFCFSKPLLLYAIWLGLRLRDVGTAKSGLVKGEVF
jgi:hypothetical protein